MTLVEMMNPFTGKRVGEEPDVHHQPDAVLDQTVERALAYYRKYCEKHQWFFGPYDDIKVPVLSPAQINAFITGMFIGPEIKDIPAAFITALIKTSCPHYTDFTLMLSKPSYTLLHNLEGTQARSLNITMHGTQGSYLLRNAKWCNLTIYGDVLHALGSGAEHCTFDIHGNARELFGEAAKASTFHLRGDENGYLGKNAKNSRFIVEGHVSGHALKDAIDCRLAILDDDVRARVEREVAERIQPCKDTLRIVKYVPEVPQ